jgi:hypothetical protein
LAIFPANDRQLLSAARQFSRADLRSWLLPWFLILLLGAATGLEWVYSPVERALGDLMVWSRSVRPEAGRAWELNRQGTDAMRTLGEMSQTSRLRQAAGGTLTSWDAVPAMMDSFEVFSISPNRFVDLYDQLPPILQSMLMKPVNLVRIRAAGNWQRVFFVREKTGERFVYLVDAYNIVLSQAELTDRFFERYTQFSTPRQGYIDELTEFPIIAPAEAFFQVMAPEGEIEFSSGDLRWIAGLSGKMMAVALSDEAENEAWEIAFEVERDERVYVHRYWLDVQTGQNLHEALKNFRRSETGREPL